MKPTDAAGEVDAVVARLWRLGEELDKAELGRRREVFRLFVDRIELRFDQVIQGKKVLCPLRFGEIYLRTEEGTMFFSVSRGDRRLTFPNDPAGASLFWSVLSQTFEFTADTFLAMAEQVGKT